MADWSTSPGVGETWAARDQAIKERDEALAKMDFSTESNIPVGTIRFANNRFEAWDGVDWADLASLYAINVDRVDGYHAGNSSGQVPVSNGTLNANLNAALLNGQAGSYYRNAGNLNAGILPAGRFNDTAHGGRGGGNLHAVATASVAGFMSAADKAAMGDVRSTLVLADGDFTSPGGEGFYCFRVGNLVTIVPNAGTIPYTASMAEAFMSTGVPTWARPSDTVTSSSYLSIPSNGDAFDQITYLEVSSAGIISSHHFDVNSLAAEPRGALSERVSLTYYVA